MVKRMLIDARHPEETRVAVVDGNRIEEFDFEAADKRQLKGNIYLAKVTRVEPSLQAAFVDYGGNRHGFLAFSEIHPDYYQIPKEDRDALLREEAEHAAEEEALRHRRHEEDTAGHDDDDVDHHDDEDHGEDHEGEGVHAVGGHDESAADALRQRRMALRRRYKIQDVIRRRQVLLVQVVKEERGNKGAALTTYLSLAGRYCVLMPNTTHGGGISRKISNQADRKRLKQIMADLALPPSMGCIVRTAGLERTKTEIKRDFDYLTRLWDEIRDNTLTSSAPALIHEDSNLIKRAIRDIYSREIDDVLVEGEDGYRAAKSFMRLLMPSHARKVQLYADPVPLFQRWSVEGQLAQMYQPVVQLRSGGYIVINPTEALVSIDINSGRSTREHNIEETALKTNLEAADEIARQLRLRDMAGLVVIDFIDMESSGNVRKVERAMKEALKNDRARIQVGRISTFGLLEMSRQRLRTGMLEASTHTCPLCDGTGLVRTTPSAALAALRGIEEEAVRGRASELTLRCAADIAIYILNRKRDDIVGLEERYGVSIDVIPDEAMRLPQFAIDAAGPPPVRMPAPPPPVIEDDFDDDLIADEELADEEAAEAEAREEAEEGERGRGRRRRRRGRRDGHDEDQPRSADQAETAHDEGEETAEETDADLDEAGEDAGAQADHAGSEQQGEGNGRRRRRRGRRGGRRNREEGGVPQPQEAAEMVAEAETGIAAVIEEAPTAEEAPGVAVAEAGTKAAETAGAVVDDADEKPAKRTTRRRPRARKAEAEAAPTAEGAKADTAGATADPVTAPAAEVVEEQPAEKPKPRRTRRKKADVEAEQAATADPVTAPAGEVVEEQPAEKPKPRRTRRKKADVEAEQTAATEAAPEVETPAAAEPDKALAEAGADASSDAAQADGEDAEGNRPVRRGWWQRTFGQ